MAKLILSLDDVVLEDIPLTKERTTIGRKPHNDIHIDNLAVSGEHAVIVTVMNDCILEDLGSTNGTLVNGVLAKRHVLRNNDVIELGKYKLKFEGLAAGARASSGRLRKDDGLASRRRESPARPTRAGKAGRASGPHGRPSPRPAALALSHARSSPYACARFGSGARCFVRLCAGPGPRGRRRGIQLRAHRPPYPGASGIVRILSGPRSGRDLKLHKPLTTLGKPGTQVAAVTRRPQGYFIAHVEGPPTNVNGRPIGAAPQPLKDGDTFEIADVRMEFLLRDEAVDAAPEPAVDSRSRAGCNRDRRLRALPVARLIAHLPADEPGPSRRTVCRRRLALRSEALLSGRATGTSNACKKSTSVEQVTRCIRRGFDLYFNLCDGAADQDTSRHRSRAHAGTPPRRVHRRDVGILRAFARSDEARLSGRGHRRPRLRAGPRRGGCRAGRLAPHVSALREALQQLFERRSFAPLARRDAGGVAPAGAQDHAATRRSADRGVHRGHGSHGAGGGKSRRSGAAQDLYADPVPLSRRRDVQALGDEVGGIRKDGDVSASTTRRSTPAFATYPRGCSSRSTARASAAAIFVSIADGVPFMLEINPNCGVYYPPADAGSADLCLLHDPEGHAGFTRRLIHAALRRHERATA